MPIRYYHNSDYSVDINNNQLQEIYNDQRTLQRVENIVNEEIKSYLIQRYDLDNEFTNTGTFSITKQYNVADRIIIDYPSFTSSQSYVFGNGVINNGEGYICKTASIGATTSFDTANVWLDLGPQYTIYYAQYPAPRFADELYYKLNDVVYWNNFTYSCRSATKDLSKTQAAQYLYTENLPNLNVIPDDSVLNSNYAYWLPGSTSSYVIPIGTLPNNTLYWTMGDNRCQQILNCGLDMILYYIERQIAPRNIPEFRMKMYKDACKWLDDVANGEFTINLLYKIPQQGSGFRAGSGLFGSDNVY
jgi:phage gp36-like protein